MSKDHWDAILASAPLNATAGTVTSKGVHFESRPEREYLSHEWDMPPPMKDLADLRRREPSFVDFTGRRFGRLVVVGVSVESFDLKGNKGALWVCRCACGRYCGRRAKSIKKAIPEARCDQCAYTEHLRFVAEGDGARHRAEAPEARKW